MPQIEFSGVEVLLGRTGPDFKKSALSELELETQLTRGETAERHRALMRAQVWATLHLADVTDDVAENLRSLQGDISVSISE